MFCVWTKLPTRSNFLPFSVDEIERITSTPHTSLRETQVVETVLQDAYTSTPHTSLRETEVGETVLQDA